MKFFYWTILIAILLIGCKSDGNQNNGDYAYIGGEIINPIDDFVIISKSKKNLDTIKLDGNNRFLYKLNNLEAGLYSFKLRSPIGLEYQMILIEPKDSILFRLNTTDFDESLVYTGKGAKKNNYLIDEFLRNEKAEKKVFEYCQLDAVAYQKEIDSIKSYKLKKLKKFKNKYETSDLFDKIALSNIEYNYYFNKEVYPFVHYGGNKNNILNALPKDFYSYRTTINYNDNFQKDNFTYNTFLRSSFSNIALKEHYKHAKNDYFKSTDLCYNLDRLALIDSLITDNEIKEQLLYDYTMRFLHKSNSVKNNNAILNYYTRTSTNGDWKEKITQYTNTLNNLKTGNIFPEIKLLDTNNTETSFSEVINSLTVINFWSQAYYNHFKESQNKIKELKIKYPEVSFIVVNIDDYGFASPLKTLKRNRISLKDQYLFKNPKTSKEELAIYPMTKTFILDKNRRIVNSNTNIFARHFEEQLLGLINR